MTLEAIKGYAGVAYCKVFSASTYIVNGARTGAVNLYAWGVANPAAAGVALLALVAALETGRRLHIVAKVQTLAGNGCAWVDAHCAWRWRVLSAAKAAAQAERNLDVAVKALESAKSQSNIPGVITRLEDAVLAADGALTQKQLRVDFLRNAYLARASDAIPANGDSERSNWEEELDDMFTKIPRTNSSTSNNQTEALNIKQSRSAAALVAKAQPAAKAKSTKV